MTTFHILASSSKRHTADAFVLDGKRIDAVEGEEQWVMAHCSCDLYGENLCWRNDQGQPLERGAFRDRAGESVHVFIDDELVDNGRQVKLVVGCDEALLSVAGRELAHFEDGRWWRSSDDGERIPTTRIVVGPANALDSVSQPWSQPLELGVRQRPSSLAAS